MTETPPRKRSLISRLITFVLIAAAAVVVLPTLWVHTWLRRKYIPVDQLKFPVLVIQPADVAPFAEWDYIPLQKFPEKSNRTPVNGTVIIDSDFNQCIQENVERKQEGEIKWIARALLPGAFRIKYKFDLRRTKITGHDAMMELLRRAPPMSADPKENEALLSAAQGQSTMAGVLDALHLYKPIEPTTAPSEATDLPTTEPAEVVDSPTTEPSDAEPTTEGAEKPPGMN